MKRNIKALSLIVAVSILFFFLTSAVFAVTLKIVTIKDLSVTVYVNQSYSLPKTIDAAMSNKTTQKVTVAWSPKTVVTSKIGTFTYRGTVIGYDKKVLLTLKVIQAPSEEVLRAINHGFVPIEIQGDWSKTITYSQFSNMIGKMISALDSNRLAQWKTAVNQALQCTKGMTRDSGMIGLFYAAQILGIADYREDIDKNWSEIHSKIGEPWNKFCHDYSLFGITNKMKALFDGNSFTYEVCGYFYSLSRISLISGKSLFDYDEKKNSMRPGDPLTRGEAICAVLRLYESIYRPTVVKGSALPKATGKNIAVYQYLTAGAANTFFITFGSPDDSYPKTPGLDATYDLMLPKGNETNSDLVFRSSITAVNTDDVWINRTNSDYEATLRFDNNRPVLAEKESGRTIYADDCGSFWLFHISVSSQYASTTTKNYRQLRLELNFNVPVSGYSGQMWVDNVKISYGSNALISYDFNSQYSKPYGEILSSTKNDGIDNCCLLWGDIDEIGAKKAFNVVKAGLVYEGSPNEENNAKLMLGIDPDKLYNPGFDFRNFTGVTLRWKGDFAFSNQVDASFDIIIPKSMFKGFKSKDSYWLLNMAVVLADEKDNIIYQRMIGEDGDVVMLKKDNFGNIYPVNGMRNVQMTEYDDCYKISLTASLKCPETEVKHVWMKIQMTGSEVLYDGYVYLDNWRISSGKTVLVKYGVDPEPLPDNLYEMYDHSNNGSYYWWNSIGPGFYYLGFDTLNLPH